MRRVMSHLRMKERVTQMRIARVKKEMRKVRTEKVREINTRRRREEKRNRGRKKGRRIGREMI